MASPQDMMMQEIVAKVMGKQMPGQPHAMDPNQPVVSPEANELAYDNLAGRKDIEAFGGDGSMSMVNELAQLIDQLPPEQQEALFATLQGGQAPTKEKGVPDAVMQQLMADEMVQ